jgi:hypothetical protein
VVNSLSPIEELATKEASYARPTINKRGIELGAFKRHGTTLKLAFHFKLFESFF